MDRANQRRQMPLPIVYLYLLAALVAVPTAAAAQTGIRYGAVIEGIADGSLRRDLESVSDTFSLRDRYPPTLNLLRHRAGNDIDLFQKVLKARGHYAAQVQIEINEKAEPVSVTFRITPGPVYVLGPTAIHVSGTAEDLRLPSPEQLGLKPGEPARGRLILDAQETLLGSAKNQGFPFPAIVERRVVVDHRSQTVAVAFEVAPGPFARFGPTAVTGLQSVDREVVLEKLPWRQGDRFNAALLSELQNRLTTTNLFSIVRIDYGEKLDEKGLLPVSVEVTERKHRSVRAGAKWSSDEGVGGKVTWEHRNLLHHGERLYLGAEATQIDLALEGAFQKPSFLRQDQSLGLDFKIADETTDAYDSKNLESAVLITRQIRKKMSAGAGLGFRASQVDQLDQKENFDLFYLPATFDWDRSDNLLDPTRGGRLSIKLAPYYDVNKTDLGFVKGFLAYSHYFKLLQKPYVLFAGRAAVGSIGGATRDGIPADLRFYAGGGGSIRGYAYQMVGPLEDGDPVGGRSLLEFSAEVRFKVTETIGFVTFLDGGSAFEAAYPDFTEALRWGAGTGVRYYTPIGPLRLDIGFPLNKRPDVDDSYQLYVSIGQAF